MIFNYIVLPIRATTYGDEEIDVFIDLSLLSTYLPRSHLRESPISGLVYSVKHVHHPNQWTWKFVIPAIQLWRGIHHLHYERTRFSKRVSYYYRSWNVCMCILYILVMGFYALTRCRGGQPLHSNVVPATPQIYSNQKSPKATIIVLTQKSHNQRSNSGM